MIAAADQRDAELPFDLREMLVVLAIEQRQKPVVVEMDLNRRLLGRTGHRTQMPVLSSGTTAAPADGRSSSRVTIAPCRLLPWTCSMRTSDSQPTRRFRAGSGAATCTGCR